MSSTLLEQTRALHADIDELEQFSTEQLVDAASTVRVAITIYVFITV